MSNAWRFERLALVNRSTLYPDARVNALAIALQLQVSNALASTWGIDAEIVPVTTDKTPPASIMQLILLDDQAQAQYLGFHYQAPDGTPQGVILVAEDQKYGVPDGATASHELCELLLDPAINSFRQAPNGDLYIQELCDAVNGRVYQSDAGHEDGSPIYLADFVLPSWFYGQGQPPYTWMEKEFGAKPIKAPFGLAPGGYISVLRNGVWVNLAGSEVTAQHLVPGEFSRRSERIRRYATQAGETLAG